MAYAGGGSDKIKQTKVEVINKCANVNDENKPTHVEDVRCEINNDEISGTGLPFLTDGATTLGTTKEIHGLAKKEIKAVLFSFSNK